MRGLLALALPLLLTACGILEQGSDLEGNPSALDRMDVITRPSTPAHPGDTLTFYVVFPDSASTRYAIRWDLDERGEELYGGCTRGVCAKWVVPMMPRGRYEHDMTVNSRRGTTLYPFETLVLP